jgi:hypothetical protein
MSNALIYAQSPDLEVRVVRCDNLGNLTIASGNGGSLATNNTIEAVQSIMGTTTFTDTETRGNMISAVRSDVLQSKVDINGTFAPLQVNSQGALYVDNVKTETLINDDYFTGNLVAGTNLGTIDLGTRNTIQFNGKTDTETFSFVMEYSNDLVNWGTDGYEPEITPILTDFRFNITRTNVCMRYMRLLCVSDGDNVLIQYSATTQ